MKSSALVSFFLVLPLAPLAPGQEAAQPEPLPIGEFKERVEGLLEEMTRTIRRRDLNAFMRELAEVVEAGALPRDAYLEELSSLLRTVPPGVALNTVVRELAAKPDVRAIEILFEALSAPDFINFRGRKLGEGQLETRHRVIELYITRLADELYERRLEGKSLPVPETLRERLLEELRAGDTRRVRSAAFLLGGLGAEGVVPSLVEASRRLEESPVTRAVVVEAIGRTEPTDAAEEIAATAVEKSRYVRLAAVPLLGHFRGDPHDELLADAFEDSLWMIRSAAVRACTYRRDVLAMDLLIGRFAKEIPRLQYDIIEALQDLTGGLLPPDPKEWPRWWKRTREDFQAARSGEDRGAGERTKIANRDLPSYFGFEVWSSQLAIVLDVSGSMASSNLSLGTSGVGLEGPVTKGNPLHIAKGQIINMLKKFTSRTRFNIIAYNDRVKTLNESLIPATRANLSRTLRFLRALKASGGTNVFGGLATALKDEEVDTIYVLSDGEPTDGLRTESDDILEAVETYNRFRKTRIYTVQIGQDSELMRVLAAFNGGEYRLLPLGES